VFLFVPFPCEVLQVPEKTGTFGSSMNAEAAS
jgi:hypothetical protein